MEKIDLKKNLAFLYKVSAKNPEIVTVPKLNYLMVDGVGDPNNSKTFMDAIEALYSMSYTIKFMIKKGPQQIDYGVMPLEALWWMDDMKEFSMENKSKWKWTIMIMQPDFVTKALFEEAKKLVAAKKSPELIKGIRMETMQEGLCAQILYIGPYDKESSTIVKLHEFIKESGYDLRGKHREIYLNDMRRTAPEKLKTIIRQPMGK